MNYLVVVDMQNDFITGVLGTAEAEAIVPMAAEKISSCAAAGWQIIFTRDTHGENYLRTREGRRLPVPHCIKGTFGWEIDRRLDTMHGKIIDKPGFGSTELPVYIAGNATPERIELIGVCTDICVISNAMLLKAAFPEADIAVDGGICAGVTPASHETALAAMRACQIDIL